MADAINAALMKNRFYEQLEYYRRSRPPKEIVSISDKRYQEILEDIPNAIASEDKSDHELWLLKNYKIVKIKETNRLIDPCNNLIYLADSELFDALHEVHIGVGHVGRSRMTTVLRTRYKNISRNVIELYSDLCEQCQKKPSKPKPMPKNIFRGQTTVIDFQTKPDGEYNFLLVYQDYLTKFTILRPLKTNCYSEVALNLLDIFSVFGAPAILSYYNNTDFIKQIIEYFRQFQKFKFFYGDYTSKKDQTYMENIILDINSKIEDWMQQNNVSHWSTGLPFIQLMKNKEYNYDILQNPYKALFGKTIKFGIIVENPSSIATDNDLEKALTGKDLIEIKNENKPPISDSNARISSSKKSKKRKKADSKESSATEPLFDDITCSDSMSETLAATKSIIESLNDSDSRNSYHNELPDSDATIKSNSTQDENSNTYNIPGSSVMDVDPNLDTIITDIVESESLHNHDNASITKHYSAKKNIFESSTESTINIKDNATIATVAPTSQELNDTANNFNIMAENINNFTSTKNSALSLPIPGLTYNISSFQSPANNFPLEQAMGIYSNTVPVFNIYAESDSTINNYVKPILNSDGSPQSINHACSATSVQQNGNFILPQSIISGLPATQSILTTCSHPQSLGNNIFSLTQPLFSTTTSAESLGNINYNLPQSISSSFPSTQSSGNTFFSVSQPMVDTHASSQLLTPNDTSFTLPQSNITFLPLTHSIITSTPSSNSLESNHFTVPHHTITYLSSSQMMGGVNYSLPQPIITSFPSQNFQNIDYNFMQSNINTLPSSNTLGDTNFKLPQSGISIIPTSLALRDTIFSVSQNIMTTPSSLKSLGDVNFNVTPTMAAALSSPQTLKDSKVTQPINNTIPTTQSFETYNFISPQTIIATVTSVQPLGDLSSTLPQSMSLPAPQTFNTNSLLSNQIITSHPSAQAFGDTNFIPSQAINNTINSLESTQEVNHTEPPSDINSSTDVNDNNSQNNLYCPSPEPLIITIPSAEIHDQSLSLTESNTDALSGKGSNLNVITQSEPIIIPLPNFESNFFQALPTLESKFYQ